MIKYIITLVAILSFPISSVAEGFGLEIDEDCTTEYLCESVEVRFKGKDAKRLREKSQELGGIVEVYEYLRNNTDTNFYISSRSNSINTLEAMSGSSEDLANTLIAMYRSMGLKSRYQRGLAKIKRDDLANWIGVQNETLAINILKKSVEVLVDESDPEYVEFEHYVVSVLVNIEDYRGAKVTPQSCEVENEVCRWVLLDPSYKLRLYDNQYRNILSNLDFDYEGYYSAETNEALKGKHPLEIYEEQAIDFLNKHYPGVSLKNVIDEGEIISEELGMLPSSLPYEFKEIYSREDNVFSRTYINFDFGGIKNEETEAYCYSKSGYIPLALVTTSYLALATRESAEGLKLDLMLGDDQLLELATLDCDGERLQKGTQFNFKYSINQSAHGVTDTKAEQNGVIGGQYILANGDQTSNWSQVKRATDSLMEISKLHPLVEGIEGEVYIDMNGSGLVDTGDELLNENINIQSQYTLHTLHVANALYFSKYKSRTKTAANLRNSHRLLLETYGFISSVEEVQKLAGATFSIIPQGLLIDLEVSKGATLKREFDWENDDGITGPISSSLEHEIWQELTGMDAVSTMRIFQLAVAGGGELLQFHDTTQIALDTAGVVSEPNSVLGSLQALGYHKGLPSGYTLKTFENILGKDMVALVLDGAEPAATEELHVVKAAPGGDVYVETFGDYFGNGMMTYSELHLARSKSDWDQLNMLMTELKTRRVFFTVPIGTTANDIDADVDYDNRTKFQVVNKFMYTKNLIAIDIKEKVGNSGGKANVTLETSYFNIEDNAWRNYNTLIEFDSSEMFEIPWCNEVSGLASDLLEVFSTCVKEWSGYNASIFNDASDYLYKLHDINSKEHNASTIKLIISRIYNPNEGDWVTFTIPSIPISNEYYFYLGFHEVHYSVAYGNKTGGRFGISNLSITAGGGFVGLTDVNDVSPSTNISGATVDPETGLNVSDVSFNNAYYTSEIRNALTNNDPVRSAHTGDPVSTVTGNMYHDETDFIIRGKDNLNYVFTRTYNSRESNADGGDLGSKNYTPLSKGWTHAYNMKLVSNDFGEFPNYPSELSPENENGRTSSVTFVDERGGEQNYLIDDHKYYDNQNGIQITNQKLESPLTFMNELKMNTDGYGIHTLTFKNGTQYIFDSQGEYLLKPGVVARLHKIIDLYGNELNFHYAGDNLTSITDNLGLTDRSGITLSYYSSGDDAGRLHTVSDWTGRTWEYQYEDGNLTKVKNPLGYSMTYTYHTEGNLLKGIFHPQERDGKFKSMTFNYYDNRKAYSYTDQHGHSETISYDLYKKSTRVTNPNGYTYEHQYDQKGLLTKMVNLDGSISRFENGPTGMRTLKKDALGNISKFDYIDNRMITEIDPLGYEKTYNYAQNGNVNAYTDKNGYDIKTDHTYFSNGDQYREGRISRTFTSSITADGLTRVGQFDQYTHYDKGHSRKVTYTNADYKSSRTKDYYYVYSSDGSYEVTEETSSLGEKNLSKKSTFDNLWRLKEIVFYKTENDVLIELKTQYHYDLLSRPIKTIDPLGNIVETLFDENGKILKQIARYKLLAENNSPLKSQCYIDAVNYPNHHSCDVNKFIYDEGDRLIEKVDLFGNTISYSYDAMGNVISTDNGNGAMLIHDYDSMNRVIKTTDQNGYSIHYAYDGAGRLIKQTNANGHSTVFTYDKAGRVLTTTTPEGRVTEIKSYDGNGNILVSKDGNGHEITNTYGFNNRLLSTKTNSDKEETAYSYSLGGNLNKITDALGQVTEFKYNAYDQLTTVIDPIIEVGTDKVVSMTYDELGNRLTYTDRLGETTLYTYDHLNRIILEEYLEDNVTAQNVYDQYGDLVRTSYAGVEYIYEYDAGHRLINKTDTRNNLSMSWKYNLLGNLIEKTNYQGDLYTYVYNSSSRLVSMSIGSPVTLQATYQYGAAGQLISRHLSNGVSTNYSFYPDGLLETMQQVAADGSLIDVREYEYDGVGNIKKMTVSNGQVETASGNQVYDYMYDASNRLTMVHSKNDLAFSEDVLRLYRYDNVGNRVFVQHIDPVTKTTITEFYVHTAGNQLIEVRYDAVDGPLKYRFEYDSNGSMVGKYDGAGNRLLNIEYDQRRSADVMTVNNQTERTSFRYDANMYRIEKQDPDVINQYLLEGEHLESVYTDGELKSKYLRGAVIDEVIVGFDKNDRGFFESQSYHHDQVNSVIAVSDHNGKSEFTKTADPFGAAYPKQNTDSITMQYTGRPLDEETGLYYYRARYYDPEIGRFISEDPIGFAGGINFYAYVGNNPLIYNDPTGNLRSVYDLGRDSIHLLANGASVVLGAGMMALGGAGTVFPEPVTTVGGIAMFAGGTVLWGTGVDGYSEAIVNIVDNVMDWDNGTSDRVKLQDLVLGDSPNSAAVIAYKVIETGTILVKPSVAMSRSFEFASDLSDFDTFLGNSADVYGESGFNLEASDLSFFVGTPGVALGGMMTKNENAFGATAPIPSFASSLGSNSMLNAYFCGN